jgi:glycosyltransferase involved in cell wall biosynthesis
MKTASRIDALSEEESGVKLAPRKVCMHVLGVAQTDVRVMRAATALVAAGFKVTVIDINWKERKPDMEEIRGVQLRHINIFHWYTSRRFKPWFLIQALHLFLCSTLCLLRAPADVYHAHDAKALPACYLAALLRHKPVIFDAHELPLSEETGTRNWRGLITFFSVLLAWMVPRCAAVITVSPCIAQEIHARYAVPNVALIRNVPVYRQVRKTNRLQQYLGLHPDARIALYQGNLQANRELDRLIRAAPFLEQDIVVVLMGSDAEGIQAHLEALIRSERMTESVRIVPPVPYTELLDWTASADVGLLIYAPGYSPNVRMCLPNKLFEYLMAGLPILASQLDAVSDVIRTYDIGQIVPSLAPIDIAVAINAMIADLSGFNRMRNNAFDAVKQDLCWEKESHRLINLYHEIQAKQARKVSPASMLFRINR